MVSIRFDILLAVEDDNDEFLTGIHFVCVNEEGKLEAATSSVDAVIALMQTPGRNSSDFLKEVARVLKPGGDFVVQEPLLAQAQELKVALFNKSSVMA